MSASDLTDTASPDAVSPADGPRHILIGTAGHIDHGKTRLGN